MAYSTNDYISHINQIKTGYLDNLWDGSASLFKDGTYYFTWLNAFIAQTIAILAGHGASNATDINRASAIYDKLTSYPCYYQNTWTHLMGGGSDNHAAVDQVVSESIFYGWKYRTELGLSSTVIDAMYDILTVNKLITSPIRVYHADPTGDFTHQLDDVIGNQVSIKWKVDKLAYAVMAGATEWGDEISTSVKHFLAYKDQINPHVGTTNLFSDWGWKYLNASSGNWPSAEYGQMCLGGFQVFLPEIWSYLNLTAGEIADLKAWQRHLLGQWQMDGYLNWDTIWSSGRGHYLSYWLWSVRSLIGMARSSYTNMGSSDSNYAKYLFDEAITTFFSMDTMRSDPQDYAVHAYPMGVEDLTIYGSYYNNPKSSPNAKMAMEIAMAIEHDLESITATQPSNLWMWGWENKHLHVSTPYYSAAILPYAPQVIGGFAGMDAIQLQHWGVSHIQVPRNVWLTGFGGYGLEAFSLRLRRNGVTQIDTSVDIPNESIVTVDGAVQSRSSYDTIEYPIDFSDNLRMFNAGQSTYMRAEVDTKFYQSKIRSSNLCQIIGAVGAQQEFLLTFPARKNVIIDYVALDDSKTTVWNGSTAQSVGSPGGSKYIHMRWAAWGKGIMIVPVNTIDASDAQVTMDTTYPSDYPKRQPDQDRTLLVYLSKNVMYTDDLLFEYDILFTDGTEENAEEVFEAWQLVNTAATWTTVEAPVLDTVPDQFTFADSYSATANSYTLSAGILPVGYTSPAVVHRLSSDLYYQYDAGAGYGGLYATDSNISPGWYIRLRGLSPSVYGQIITRRISIGGIEADWRLTTGQPWDLSPSPASVVNAEINTFVESDEIAVNNTYGHYSVFYASVLNAVECQCRSKSALGTWTSWLDGTGTVSFSGSVAIQFRLKTGAAYNTTAVMTVMFGTTTRTFSVTTKDNNADVIPDQFTFQDKVDQARSVICESSSVPITGITSNPSVSITPSGFTLGVNTGLSYSTDNGVTFSAYSNNPIFPVTLITHIKVAVLTSAVFETTVSLQVTLGGVTDTFSATTAPDLDRVPDQFAFALEGNHAPSSLVTSAPVALTGMTGAPLVSIDSLYGGEYSFSYDNEISWGSWSSQTAQLTQVPTHVRVRHVSSEFDAVSTSSTLTIGGVSATFTVITKVAEYADVLRVNTSLGVLTFAENINGQLLCKTSQGILRLKLDYTGQVFINTSLGPLALK